jgi:hypothetical protein
MNATFRASRSSFAITRGCAVKAGKLQGFGKLRPIAALAALDFRHLGDQPPIAVEKIAYGGLLCLQAEPGEALPLLC